MPLLPLRWCPEPGAWNPTCVPAVPGSAGQMWDVAPEWDAVLGSDESQAGKFTVETGKKKGSNSSSLAIKIALAHKDVRFG